MCIYIQKNHPDRDALIRFATVQADMMADALAKWTEQDWADAELACSLSDEEYEILAKERGW